jgi:hypothetical protein
MRISLNHVITLTFLASQCLQRRYRSFEKHVFLPSRQVYRELPLHFNTFFTLTVHTVSTDYALRIRISSRLRGLRELTRLTRAYESYEPTFVYIPIMSITWASFRQHVKLEMEVGPSTDVHYCKKYRQVRRVDMPPYTHATWHHQRSQNIRFLRWP